VLLERPQRTKRVVRHPSAQPAGADDTGKRRCFVSQRLDTLSRREREEGADASSVDADTRARKHLDRFAARAEEACERIDAGNLRSDFDPGHGRLGDTRLVGERALRKAGSPASTPEGSACIHPTMIA
jgi:hypothetical protein